MSETEQKKEQNGTVKEKEVAPLSGVGGKFLKFESDNRIFFTFTNFRTIEDPNPQGDMYYSWTCDLMNWNGEKATPEQVLKVSHANFREKMHDFLKDKKRLGIYSVGVKITDKKGKKFLYDLEDFKVLSEGLSD